LAISDAAPDSALPITHLTLVTMEIAPAPAMEDTAERQSLSELDAFITPTLHLTTLNVGRANASWDLPVREFSPPQGAPAVNATLSVQVAAGASSHATLPIALSRQLPARLQIGPLPHCRADIRRLAPVPIADPLFTQRPFSSGAGGHPDGNGTATYAMVLSNEGGIRRPGFRNLY